MLHVYFRIEYHPRCGAVERMIQPSQCKAAVFLTALLGLAGGCVGLGVTGPLDGTQPSDGNGFDPGDGGVDLAVTLRVSNPSPRPNQLVTLTCSLVSGGRANVTFNFQPQDGRLAVDHDAGTARFIVQESDVGVARIFTCTASDENGVGEPSDPQAITASQ
jgi:hypothetical protein